MRRDQENLYLQRINTVISYVRDNMDGDLSVDKLARVAGFSPFHFHRIFKSITGETLNELVTRLRLERVVMLLRSTPKLSITEAAFECGFKSVPVFSRAFKKQYGFNARQWDRQSPLKNSKNDQAREGFPHYTLGNLRNATKQDGVEVRIKSLPAQRLAYIRIYDGYRKPQRILDAYQHLIDWYCGKGGKLEKTTLYGMSQDDPEVTPLKLCRFDWCLSVPAQWRAEGEINMRTLPACRVATIHCRGDVMQEVKAFHHLYLYWLPRSHYQPANLPALEIYRRQPAELGWETYDMDCAVPIVAL